MKPIKYLIVDDEPLAHKSLKFLLKTYTQFQFIGSCYNAFDAHVYIKEHKPDLLFLDMNMPDMNGMELLKNIHQPIKVVITTAHADFAVEGYEYGVIDFLLKPISNERLFKAMIRIMDAFSYVDDLEKSFKAKYEKENNYIYGTPDKTVFERIYFKEIKYLKKVGII